jgi:uncharacterized HAD superfamily protein
MRIGIDIDDTISKTNEKLVEEAIKYDRERVKGKGFKDPDAYSFMEMFYWNVVDVDTFLKTFRAGNSFLELDAKEGAQEVINKLYDEGNEIYFITRRNNSFKMKHMTKKWLKKNGFKYNKVFFYIKDKGKFGSDLELDYFIDNDEKNVYEALEYGIKSYLMDTKYNKDVLDLERVNSWSEFYNKIK